MARSESVARIFGYRPVGRDCVKQLQHRTPVLLTIPRRSVLVAAVVVAAMGATMGSVLLAADGNAAWVEELNRLSRFIGQTLSPEELAALAAQSSKQPEVQALRSALLYRADPAQYRADFEADFTVDDYASRARGKKTEITRDEFVARLEEIESAYPNLQRHAQLLVAFVRVRSANLWFPDADRLLSAARFLRAAVLVQVFKGSTIDALTVANGLDQTARERFETGRKKNDSR